MRASSIRRIGDPPPRLAEDLVDFRVSLPNLQLAGTRVSDGGSVGTSSQWTRAICPDRYRNPERIARGGMGEIFRAEDADLARVVASRCSRTATPTTRRSAARFTREALAAARLSHAPSTVTIFDVGEHDGRPYIVMEYLPGGSLADRLERDGRAAGRTLARLARAGRGGARRRARERDRPPRRQAGEPAARQRRARQGRRLRRRQRGRPRLAHRGGHRRRHRRLPGAGAGARRAGHARERPLRARGRRLRVLDGQAALRARVLDRRGAGARERPDPAGLGLNPELPPELDDALARGLAKEPEHRYDSPADLVHALRDALDEAAAGRRLRRWLRSRRVGRAAGRLH